MKINDDYTELVLLLTGTIKPNSILVEHSDVEIRKNEYVRALKYYSKIAKVYFLEKKFYIINSNRKLNRLIRRLIR